MKDSAGSDCFVFAASHSDVDRVVQLAVKHNVVIIPFGGE